LKEEFMSAFVRAFALVIIAALASYANPVPGYYQTNLVSDISGLAPVTDPKLVNPWGMSQTPTSPIWVSNNGSNTSTLYMGTGQPAALIVAVPGAPTGQVFNGGAGFNGDRFIFATESGEIRGWRPALGTLTEALELNPDANVYKGLAIASVGSDSYLYAADFHNGVIHVIPSTGAPALTGNFGDPNLPSGYAPFNIQNIGGQLYVAYAKRDGNTDEEQAGAGLGFVDIFGVNGNLVKRLTSNGPLNAPWGMAQAPANWGPFSGSFLVGNFGDGTINAFDPNDGSFRGTLSDANGNPIVIGGLWGLMFGSGAGGKSDKALYFTAGINDEANGLFGTLQATPEPGTFGLLALGAGAMALVTRRRRA